MGQQKKHIQKARNLIMKYQESYVELERMQKRYDRLIFFNTKGITKCLPSGQALRRIRKSKPGLEEVVKGMNKDEICALLRSLKERMK